MGSSFGKLFQISTWGESHGDSVGVIVDGCPPGLPITVEEIQLELDRRRPGQSKIVTQRKESDTVVIHSGVYEGKTLGTPIALSVKNKDHRPGAYDEMRDKFRPSHADFTYQSKYGIRAIEGGGRSSARETIARVAAGAIAKKALKLGAGIEILSYVERIHDIELAELKEEPTMEAIESNIVRCPDPEIAERMVQRVEQVRKEGDSVGGSIRCSIKGLPAGLGIPVFDRLEADLAKAMLSIPASKGFMVGSGFEGSKMKGSEHNDLFEMKDGRIGTQTNRSGGIQGGISNGEEVYCNIAFKPTATILKLQESLTLKGEKTEIQGKGRHDPCVLPRAVPIVDSMAALVVMDHYMRYKAQCDSFDFSKQ